MAENNRKCFKCGRSPNVDPSTKLYRFPKPGSTNSLRCELWAKYCFPDKQWNSEKFQQKLYSEHRMLCDRHFKRTSFSDYPTSFTKLHRFAAPDDEPPGTHASTDVGDKDHQFKKPAIPPPAANKLPGFPLMVAGQPVIPGSYTIVIQQEDQDTVVDKATETTQTDQKQNVAAQKQNVAVQKQNVAVQKPRDTVLEQNVAVQKQNVAVQKQNVAVQKPKDTVQEKKVVVVKKNVVTQKRDVVSKKQNNTLQKAMTLAELPVLDSKLVEKDVMDVDDDFDDRDHDDDDHGPWRVDDDDKDNADSFAQDPDSHVIEHVVEIETQPEEPKHAEELDSTRVKPSSKNIKEEQVVEYGHCRCCLQPGTHGVVDAIEALGCFNILVATDPRVSRLVCKTCDKFLHEARRFRDMVVDSQKVLLDSLANSDVKYPSVWSNPSGLTTSHEDEIEQELIDIQQQSGLKDEGMQEDMSDDEDTKVDLEMLDEAATLKRPIFSRLSDYPDAQMGSEVNYENLTPKGFKDMVQANKKKRAKLSVHIRENIIKILDYSTVLPFLSVTGEKFDCIYCEGTFYNIDQLRAHVEESHRNESTDFKHGILKLLPEMVLLVDISCIKCRLCDEQFTTIDNLVQHLVETHKKEYHKICLDPPHNMVPFNFSLDVLQCIECQEIFPDYKKLRMHVIKHYGPYLCHQCGSKFLYVKLYRQHILTHQNYNKNKQTCEECGTKFRNKKLLLYHYYKNHYDIMKKQTEQPDIKVFDEDVKDETRDVAYECTLCNNGTTYTLSAAYMHRIGHLNNTREGPYTCEVCGHISTVKKDFRIHLQGHYGIKNYVCEVCKKTFKKNSQLSDHMSTHLNLKFHCPLCDTTLYDKKLLMRHVKNQHPDVNVAFSL